MKISLINLKRMKLLLIVAALVFVANSTQSQNQENLRDILDVNVFFVSTDGSDTNDGTSWGTAYANIQPAINAAEAAGGGEVWVAEGTYSPTEHLSDAYGQQTDDVYKTFIMYSGIGLYGGFEGTETTKEIGVPGGRQLSSGGEEYEFEHPVILDGSPDNSYHVVWFGSSGFEGFTYDFSLGSITVQVPSPLIGQTILDGFTITGGFANEDTKLEDTEDAKKKYVHTLGGGVAVNGNGMVRRCIVHDNKARYGGAGIAMFRGAVVEKCIVYNNEATGVNFYDPGIFGIGAIDYWRTDGAGIISSGIESDQNLIDQCVIHDNLCRANDNYPGTPSSNSDKTNNGGGLYLYNTLIKNSVIHGNQIVPNPSPYDGNSSASCGGGVYLFSASVMDSCEVYNNSYQGSSQNRSGVFLADYEEEAEDYTDLMVKNSYVHSHSDGIGIVSDAQYSTVINTRVANNSSMGIYGYGNCNNFRTINCLIYNNQSYGWGQSNNSNNANNSLYHTTVVQNGGGISLGNNNNHVVYNSLVWGNNNNPSNISNATVSNSAFSFTPPSGTGNIELDAGNNDPSGPKFVNPTADYGAGAAGWENSDWHIQDGSPCIDAGDIGLTPSSVTTDFYGNTRKISCETDIGAHESPYGNPPEVIFTINGNEFTPGMTIGTCEGQNVSFDFSEAVTGTYPFEIEWTLDGTPDNATVTGDGENLFSQTLSPGTHELQVTGIEDDNGCVTDAGPLYAEIVVSAPAGNVYYVTTNGDDSNDGQCWSTAFATIQHAIDMAESAGTDYEVWVSEGTYSPTEYLSDYTGQQSDPEYKSFIMRSGVDVYGGFAGTEITKDIGVSGGRQLTGSGNAWDFAHHTVLDGTGSYHAVWFGSAGFSAETYEGTEVYTPNQLPDTAILNGFTISGAFANEDVPVQDGNEDSKEKFVHTAGGGVALVGKGFLQRCIVQDNKARYGGAGVGMFDGAHVDQCLVQNNEAVGVHFIVGLGFFINYWRTDGAGIVAIGREDSNCVIDNSEISNNLGRANDNYPGTSSADNDKTNNGGGIYLYNSVIKNSVVSGNNIVKNPSPYDGNSGASCGGGVYLYSRGLVDNCEVTDNGFLGDSQNGAGIWVADYGTEAVAEDYDDLIVQNCFVHSNRDGVALVSDAQYSTFINNKVSNNQGLGIYGYGNCNNCRIINCIMSNNQSYGYGQSSNSENANNTLINSTVVNNGGSVTIGNTNNQKIYNSIIWGNNNNPSNISNATEIANSAFSFTPPAGPDNIELDPGNNDPNGPKFVDPTGNYGTGVSGWETADWHIAETSPCVDAGDNNLLPEDVMTDFYGATRLMGCELDIGAAEADVADAIEISFALNGNDMSPGLEINLCEGEALSFDFQDASLGTFPFTVSWTINDNPSHPLSGTDVEITTAGQNLFNENPSAGNYEIEVTSVTDDNGCVLFDLSDFSATINVNPEPDVTFAINGEEMTSGYTADFCEGGNEIFSFQNAVGDNYPYTVSWTVNGDPGNPFSGTDIEVTGAGQELFNEDLSAGTYDIEVTQITDNFGCEVSDLSSYTGTINVHPEPVVSFTINTMEMTPGYEAEACDGDNIVFSFEDATNGDYPFTISWTINGDDTHPQAGTDVLVSNPAQELFNTSLDPGSYDIQLTSVSDNNGCEITDLSSYNATITVFQQPGVNFAMNGDVLDPGDEVEVCEGAEATLTLNEAINGIYSFLLSWTINGDPGHSLSGENVVVNSPGGELFSTTPAAGSYDIQFTMIADGHGCEVSNPASYSYTLTIAPGPDDPTATATPAEVCEGENSEITASGSGADHFDVYDSETGGSLVGTTPLTVTPGETSSYFVEAVSAIGCINDGGRTEVEVTVNEAPGNPVLPSATDSICIGETYEINATSEGAAEINVYNAETGGTLLGTVPFETDPETDTDYYLEAVAANGCLNDGGRTDFSLLVFDYPEITIDVSDSEICPTETSQINVSGANNYLWSPEEWLSCSVCSNPLFTPPEIMSNKQDVILTVNASSNGCTVMDSVTITVLADAEITIPQGLEPNGDGMDDIWTIQDIARFPDNEITVFNRWGNEVYSAAPYNNDWNGVTNDGNDLPPGTYYYVLKLGNEDNDVFTGYIYITR